MLARRIVPVACSGSFAALVLLACGPQVELETDSTEGSGSTTDAPTTVATTVGPGTDPTLDTGTDDGPPGPTERAVDILFVIDNSGSMGEEQAMLSYSIAALFEVLDSAEAPIDYRIGVTTTDNGNPWCGTTGPEAGNLRLTSCRSRPTEFTFNGATVIEAFEEACAASCPEEWTNIEIQPTTVEGQNAVRPWIESIAGVTNLPAGLSTVQAFQCFAPQGIDGCGFESHLESMYKAILRFQDQNEDQYGFHREGALLAIVLVTDETDCSYNNDWETIFLPDGDRVFWSDQTAASPTSAVCWNAGVACDGDQCHAASFDVGGTEVSEAQADEEAVLRPVSRYTAQLAELGAYVFAINGVGLDGVPLYQPSLMDPQFQNDFGIGPGCESQTGRAVPPVREHELIETISGSGNESSVCAVDYSPAFSAFAQGIVDRLP